MDKKTQRKIQRDARKKSRELKVCSDAEFNEFMDYLTQKELSVGNDITNTTRNIQKLERRPRTRNVSDFGKMEATALGCVASVGTAVVLSMLGGLDEAQTVVTSGVGAIVGGGIGNALAEVYHKKPVSNAVTDIMLHVKRNKLAKLIEEREKNECFLNSLDMEMSR